LTTGNMSVLHLSYRAIFGQYKLKHMGITKGQKYWEHWAPASSRWGHFWPSRNTTLPHKCHHGTFGCSRSRDWCV